MPSIKPFLKKFVSMLPEAQQETIRHLYKRTRLLKEAGVKKTKLYRCCALMWVKPEIVDIDEITICGPGADEVLVRTEMTAISTGTETAALLGLPGATRGFPFMPGYSGTGVVIAKGKHVENIHVGQRVAGRLRHASHNVVKQDYCFPVHESADPVSEAFIELGIIVMQAVRKADIKPGMPVAVLGCGIIGQLAVRLIKLRGGCPVSAFAQSDSRRQHALNGRFGADQFLLCEHIPELSQRFPVVFESTGVPSAFLPALDLVETNGEIILLGSTRGLTRPLDAAKLLTEKNIQLKAAHITNIPEQESSPGRWTYRDEGLLWLEYVGKHMLNASDFVSHFLKPESAPGFYMDTIENKIKPAGAIINWGEK